MSANAKPSNGQPVNMKRALTEAADSSDLALSMRQVLVGALTEMGGPTEFGREVVRLFKSPETSAASKAAIAANLMKMLGLYGNEDDNDELADDEMLDRWQELQRQEQRRSTLDSLESNYDE